MLSVSIDNLQHLQNLQGTTVASAGQQQSLSKHPTATGGCSFALHHDSTGGTSVLGPHLVLTSESAPAYTTLPFNAATQHTTSIQQILQHHVRQSSILQSTIQQQTQQRLFTETRNGFIETSGKYIPLSASSFPSRSSSSPQKVPVQPVLQQVMNNTRPLLQLYQSVTGSTTATASIASQIKVPPQILPKPLASIVNNTGIKQQATINSPTGSLFLNQIIPNGGVIIGQQTSAGIQLVLKSPSQTLSSVVPNVQLIVSNNKTVSSSPSAIFVQANQIPTSQQVVQLIAGQSLQLQQLQLSSGSTLLAVPSLQQNRYAESTTLASPITPLPIQTNFPGQNIISKPNKNVERAYSSNSTSNSPNYNYKRKRRKEERTKLDLANLIKISGIDEDDVGYIPPSVLTPPSSVSSLSSISPSPTFASTASSPSPPAVAHVQRVQIGSPQLPQKLTFRQHQSVQQCLSQPVASTFGLSASPSVIESMQTSSTQQTALRLSISDDGSLVLQQPHTSSQNIASNLEISAHRQVIQINPEKNLLERPVLGLVGSDSVIVKTATGYEIQQPSMALQGISNEQNFMLTKKSVTTTNDIQLVTDTSSTKGLTIKNIQIAQNSPAVFVNEHQRVQIMTSEVDKSSLSVASKQQNHIQIISKKVLGAKRRSSGFCNKNQALPSPNDTLPQSTQFLVDIPKQTSALPSNEEHIHQVNRTKDKDQDLGISKALSSQDTKVSVIELPQNCLVSLEKAGHIQLVTNNEKQMANEIQLNKCDETISFEKTSYPIVNQERVLNTSTAAINKEQPKKKDEIQLSTHLKPELQKLKDSSDQLLVDRSKNSQMQMKEITIQQHKNYIQYRNQLKIAETIPDGSETTKPNLFNDEQHKIPINVADQKPQSVCNSIISSSSPTSSFYSMPLLTDSNSYNDTCKSNLFSIDTSSPSSAISNSQIVDSKALQISKEKSNLKKIGNNSAITVPLSNNSSSLSKTTCNSSQITLHSFVDAHSNINIRTIQPCSKSNPTKSKKSAVVKPIIILPEMKNKDMNSPTCLNPISNTESHFNGIQRVQTIQLTSQKQQSLKTVQSEISILSAKKSRTRAEQVTLQKLFNEQQQILLSGKIIPTTHGQNSQGLTFVSTPIRLVPPPNLPPSSSFSSPQVASLSVPTAPPQLLLSPSPSAPSPLSPSKRAFLISEQLEIDKKFVTHPDLNAPFSSVSDACKRLLHYHCMDESVLSEKDLNKADEIFEATAKHLLDKKSQMFNKFSYLLCQESMREYKISELIMLDRMFVTDESLSFDEIRVEASQPLTTKLEECTQLPFLEDNISTPAEDDDPPPILYPFDFSPAPSPTLNVELSDQNSLSWSPKHKLIDDSMPDIGPKMKKHCPDEEEINAQVQKAIDSILNLQRSDSKTDEVARNIFPLL